MPTHCLTKHSICWRLGTRASQRGHPRLRQRHAPFPVDDAARDRWVKLMTAALSEANLPAEVDEVLRSFFDSTATFLQNRTGSPFR